MKQQLKTITRIIILILGLIVTQNNYGQIINLNSLKFGCINRSDSIKGSRVIYKVTKDSIDFIFSNIYVKDGNSNHLYPYKYEIYYSDTLSGNLTYSASINTSEDSISINYNINNTKASGNYFVKFLFSASGGSYTYNSNICISRLLSLACTSSTCQLISNPDFSSVSFADGSNPFPSGAISCWYNAWGTPQMVASTTPSLNFAMFWHGAYSPPLGGQIGEAIKQNLVSSLVSGQKYALVVEAEKLASSTYSVDNFIVKLSNSSTSGLPIVSTYPGDVIPSFPSQQILNSNEINSSTSWKTLGGCFTAGSNYNQIVLYPQQNSGNNNAAWVAVKSVRLYNITSQSETKNIACSTGSVQIGNFSCLIPNATYAWSPTTGLSNPNIINPVANPTITTNYTLTVTIPYTSSSCQFTHTSQVIVPVPPTLLASASPSAICPGASTSLTASGASTYTWNPGALTGSVVVVSPTVTTTYTVTGTNAVGCTNTKTVTVTINPLPAVTIAPTTPSICTGQSITLTAGGANSYTWNTGPTTSTVTVSPSITTNYTVAGTNTITGCVNTKSVSLTVYALPVLTITPSSATICAGTTGTLTATGASTYSWNPGGLTGSTAVVSPIVNTTYTVTGTSAAGCTNTKTVNVTIMPQPTVAVVVTANASSVAVCSSGSATLIAGGASTYTWMPGSIGTATAVVSPTAATVYTVTGTHVSGCGTATASILVNPVISTLCCSAPNITFGTSLTSSVNTSGAYTTLGTVIDLQGTVTFTGTTTFTGCTLRLAPKTLLNVSPQTTLTFDNCKLFGCSELWDGIILQGSNGTLCANIIINKGTTIEDMYNGIRVDYQNKAYNDQSLSAIGSMSISSSTFNKNYISVQIKNSTGDKLVTNPYPFSMANSTVSSSASTTSPGSGLKPSSTYTYAYNQITNGSGGTSASYLNFPRSFTGIYLANLTGTLTPVIVGDKTTGANTNTFDNLDYGIYATNANLNVYNNYFKNLKGSQKSTDPGLLDPDNPTPPAPGPFEIGIAIVATHTTTDTYYLTVGSGTVLPSSSSPFPLSNKFEDCNKGIHSANNFRSTVLGNLFTTASTDIPVVTGNPPTINPDLFYFYKGQNAMWLTGASGAFDLRTNYIRNHSVAIYADFTGISTHVEGKINNNDIAAPSSTVYCRQAVQLLQAGGINPNFMEVKNNSISEVYNGVSASAVLSGLQINNNSISVESTAKTYNYSATTQRTGVSLSSCEYANIQGNTLTSNASSAPSTSTTANYLNGAYLTNSKNGKVECNSATKLGRCFVFQGTCDNSWKVNDMSNSFTGLEIRILGRIGSQGAPTGSPAPNLSANTWTTITQHTNILSSAGNNTLSPLYVLNGSTTTPTLNFGTSGQQYTVNINQGIRITTGTSYTCNAGSAQRLAAGNNTGNSSNMRTTGAEDSLANYISLANSNENTYDVFTDEFMYQNKQLVFKLIDADSLNVANGSTLDHFYQANQNTAIGQLTQVQQAIANADVSAAHAANASVSPSNAVEYKHQRANQLVLKYLTDRFYTYTDAEKQDLYSYANECIVKGYYVVQARNMVNIITNQIVNYNDDCEAEANAQRKAKASANGIAKQLSFAILPNPNNGEMTLVYDLGSYAKASFELLDVTGKVINKQSINTTVGTLAINEQNLSNGIYFYRILVGETILKTDKIVVIK